MPAQKTKKKVVSKPAAASRRSAAPRKEASMWDQKFFEKEQKDFFKNHPMAQMLLTVFLIAVALFFVTVYVFQYR